MTDALSGRSLPKFRVVQAAYDLKSLVRPSERELALGLMQAGIPEAVAMDRIGDFLERPLLTLVTESESHVSDRLGDSLRAERSANSRLLPMLGLWLADILLSERDGTFAPHIWTEWQPYLLQLPRTEKAAYMNAFREVGPYGYDQIDPPVDATHCLSEDRGSILAPLRAIAESATDDELQAISSADRGDQAEEHYKKLVEVIRERECVVSPDDHWTPLETIQLRSHTPGNVGHLVAFDVLLITSIVHGDRYSDIEFRWERQYAELNKLPARTRAPILAGIRYLYESDREWEPLPWRNRKPFDRAMLLPPAQSV